MDVATENTIFGDTSIKSSFTLSNSDVSSRKRPDTLLLRNVHLHQQVRSPVLLDNYLLHQLLNKLLYL